MSQTTVTLRRTLFNALLDFRKPDGSELRVSEFRTVCAVLSLNSRAVFTAELNALIGVHKASPAIRTMVQLGIITRTGKIPGCCIYSINRNTTEWGKLITGDDDE